MGEPARTLGESGVGRDDDREHARALLGVEAHRAGLAAVEHEPAVFVETNLIQVIEFTLMKAAPRFTADDRRRALVKSQAIYASRGVTAADAQASEQ